MRVALLLPHLCNPSNDDPIAELRQVALIWEPCRPDGSLAEWLTALGWDSSPLTTADAGRWIATWQVEQEKRETKTANENKEQKTAKTGEQLERKKEFTL